MAAPLRAAFADPWIGFVQTPQDYRGWRHAPVLPAAYYSYKYFFAVSQPSRNEHDGAIFAGTMGLIRRVALDELGGWDEWCITEDAELSLRLLRAGWHGLHVDEAFGPRHHAADLRGAQGPAVPLVLRRHPDPAHALAVAAARPRSRANHLTAGQRWAYLSGALQWYGDLLGLLFFIFLLAGAANLATGGGQLFRKLTVFLVAAVPVLVAARPGPRDGAAAPRYRRVLAGRDRRVLHLAVHLAGGGARVGARPVRQEGRVPAHPEDERADQLVGGAARQLGRDRRWPCSASPASRPR